MESTTSNIEVKVYKYRWVVLVIFCLFTINNFVQFLEYSIIADIIVDYYEDIDSFMVDLSGLIFFIIYLIFFLPVSYLIEKFDMKITAVSSTGLTLIGNIVKVFSTNKNQFYMVLIGQAFCGIGQVYMISIPSKFAALWFGAEEVSTACAVAVLGTQLGAALGSIIPPFMVTNGTATSIESDLKHMVYFNVIFSAVIFVIVLLFFKAKPDSPPSQSQLEIIQSEERSVVFQRLKEILKNKDYLILLVAFGVSLGLWNSFGIVLNNLFTHYFPNNGTDAGIIAAIAIVCGGCIGSVVFGVLLDKTHQFKKVSFGTLLASSAALALVLIVFINHSRIGSYITIPIFGFFLASTLVVSFEYVLEVTYPIPESLSCSILNASIYVFGIIGTVLLEALFDGIGYDCTFIVVAVTLLVCSGLILLVSNNLRRRDANLKNQTTEEAHVNESYTPSP